MRNASYEGLWTCDMLIYNFLDKSNHKRQISQETSLFSYGNIDEWAINTMVYVDMGIEHKLRINCSDKGYGHNHHNQSGSDITS